MGVKNNNSKYKIYEHEIINWLDCDKVMLVEIKTAVLLLVGNVT